MKRKWGKSLRSPTDDCGDTHGNKDLGSTNQNFVFYRPNHDYLVDVLCMVSVRFRRLATDYSLWEGYAGIGADKNPRKAEFVVQECLNRGTRVFSMFGTVAEFLPVLTSPRYAEYINPTTRFPNLKLSGRSEPDTTDFIEWIDNSSSDDSGGCCGCCGGDVKEEA